MGACRAPGFPCALCWARFIQDSGGTRRENAGLCLYDDGLPAMNGQGKVQNGEAIRFYP
jgi:hypothetical protein